MSAAAELERPGYVDHGPVRRRWVGRDGRAVLLTARGLIFTREPAGPWVEYGPGTRADARALAGLFLGEARLKPVDDAAVRAEPERDGALPASFWRARYKPDQGMHGVSVVDLSPDPRTAPERRAAAEAERARRVAYYALRASAHLPLFPLPADYGAAHGAA